MGATEDCFDTAWWWHWIFEFPGDRGEFFHSYVTHTHRVEREREVKAQNSILWCSMRESHKEPGLSPPATSTRNKWPTCGPPAGCTLSLSSFSGVLCKTRAEINACRTKHVYLSTFLKSGTAGRILINFGILIPSNTTPTSYFLIFLQSVIPNDRHGLVRWERH